MERSLSLEKDIEKLSLKYKNDMEDEDYEDEDI
jgi:hypothetical protein